VNFVVGQGKDWSIEIRDRATRALYDPPKLIAVVRKPSGETVHEYGVSLSVERVSVGLYRMSLFLDEAGHWTRRWQAFDVDDNPLECVEHNFHVRPSSAVEPLG
jgi:hypothetical protein